jgi:hypothetical protein
MRALVMIFLFALAIVLRAQIALTSINTNVLLVSSNTNSLNVSNAVLVLSGLRLGMEMTNVDRYLNAHGVTNRPFGGVSLDRGEHYAFYYDFPGTDSTLVLETRSRRTGPDLFDWGYPVLERGRIQRLGVDTFLITFTNVP